MKSVMNKLIRDEKGAALILALILLLVAGLLAASLLGYMGTGLITGEIYETRTAELYAADAGVEDAMWKIQHPLEAGLLGCGTNWTHTYPEAGEPPFVVNGKSVVVTIQHLGAGTYNISAVAVTLDGGNTAAIDSSTAVEAYVSFLYMDFSSLLDNAIVSQDSVWIKGDTEVHGDVWLPDKDDPTKIALDPNASINGTVKDEDDISITWPTFDQLSDYYWEDVKQLEGEAYPDGYVINIPAGTTEEDPYIIGPLLAAGDLTITGSGWIKLGGTIYFQGSLFTNPTPEIHVSLEGHTIFAEGEINLLPGVWLHGSGSIIARYDIDFRPNLDTEGENFVLVLSLEGEVQFNPGTDFTGCIAGSAHVQLQPGNTISWVSPEGKGLDFPMGAGDDPNELPPGTELNIKSWEIIQQ